MHTNVLISVQSLADALQANCFVILDARFALEAPDWGAQMYQMAHLPGAYYVHLDRDLSDHHKAATLGRHPLPDAAAFAARCARLGLRQNDQIVCYDQGPGMFAARLWWMLGALGYQNVRVLDGGFAAWQALGLPLSESDEAEPVPTAALATTQWLWSALDVETVEAGLRSGRLLLVDARGRERYLGETEPIDVVAGHMPGAVNHPFTENLSDGKFKPAAALRAQWLALLESRQAADVVHMCGSGVTACHNVLAMCHAGLPGSRLFPASYSGYIADPARRSQVRLGQDS